MKDARTRSKRHVHHRFTIKPLCSALLMAFAPLAESETLLGPSSAGYTVADDTSYRVEAGTLITTEGNAAVSIEGQENFAFYNSGHIKGSLLGGTTGVRVLATGELTNEPSGAIWGTTFGVLVQSGTLQLTNRGDITAGASHAVSFDGASSGNVDNYGTLNGGVLAPVGANVVGIRSTTTGDVTVNNHADGSIVGRGGIQGVEGGYLTVRNAGLISGSEYGVSGENIHIDNHSGGIINGGTSSGVVLGGDSSLVNRATIGSNGAAAVRIDGANTSVTLGQGSVLNNSGATAILSNSKGNTLTLVETGSEDGDIAASATGNGLAALNVDAGADWTWLGDIALAGASADTLTINGDLTLAGTVSQNGGGGTAIARGATLTLGNGSTSGIVNGDIANEGTLVFNRANTVLYDGVLSGSGAVNQAGTGTTTLTAAGSTQGAVNVQAGTLKLATGSSLSAGSFTIGNGAIAAIGADATLQTDTFTQNADALLSLTLGSTQPVITADDATVYGALRVDGFSATAPVSASGLADAAFRVIETTYGLTGDFSSVTLGGPSAADYLTMAGGKTADNLSYDLTFGMRWLAGQTAGNGVFTLANASDAFNVDIALANQTGAFDSGWDGKSLTKNGAGLLVVSAQAAYTGDTMVNGGTLRTDVADAIATSRAVTIADGATLDLNGNDQRISNLAGDGDVTLGTATLTIDNTLDTTLAGAISGTGSVAKTGAGTLTLAGTSTYDGGTSVDAGKLVATHGGALGTGVVGNQAALQLDFARDGTFANTLAGTGTLTKTGVGMATMTGAGSTQGAVSVDAGELRFMQDGAFSTTGDYTTATGATTSVSGQSSLVVGQHLTVDGTLNVQAGSAPAVVANTASLGNGSSFNLIGFSAAESASASEMASSRTTIIRTDAPNGLTGQFSSVRIASADSPADFVTVSAGYNAQEFVVGTGLTWYGAYGLTPQVAHGTFTLTQADGEFDVDAVLADQAANADTGWDGKSLTKAGAGTLQLSKTNTYTGGTFINAGTLRAGAENVIASSAQVVVAQDATLDLNGFDQTVRNLSGAGDVALGSGTLRIDSQIDTALGGAISGTGALTKAGAGTFTLSGHSHYSGATTVESGTLALDNAQLAGTSQVTVARGATLGGYGGVGGNVVNNGLLAVADALPQFANRAAGTFVVGGTLVNSGDISMGSAVPGSTLTVNGDYSGNNGRITLYTTLDGDQSATDRLVVHGNTAGQTTLSIQNAGGTGAATQNGIQVVQVDGQSNGVFALDRRMVAGAYDYQLFKGGVNTPDDGDWYLRSAVTDPAPRAETGAYLANQSAALGMFMHTYRDRAGIAVPLDDGDEGGKLDTWLRVTGGHASGQAANGRVNESANAVVVQAGIDLLNRVTDNQRWQAGVMAGYGHASTHADTLGNPASARGAVNGASVGLYGTWRGEVADIGGPYVDTWAQFAYFGNSVDGTGLASENYNSHLWSGSIEGGWAFPIGYTKNGVVQLEPQAQLAYTAYRSGDHTESTGTLVQDGDAGGLTTRLGARLFHLHDSESATTWLPYVEMNWWHNALGSEMAFDNVTVAQDGPRDRFEMKAGANVQFGRQWSAWGNVAYQVGGGGYQSITGLLGTKYAW